MKYNTPPNKTSVQAESDYFSYGLLVVTLGLCLFGLIGFYQNQRKQRKRDAISLESTLYKEIRYYFNNRTPNDLRKRVLEGRTHKDKKVDEDMSLIHLIEKYPEANGLKACLVEALLWIFPHKAEGIAEHMKTYLKKDYFTDSAQQLALYYRLTWAYALARESYDEAYQAAVEALEEPLFSGNGRPFKLIFYRLAVEALYAKHEAQEDLFYFNDRDAHVKKDEGNLAQDVLEAQRLAAAAHKLFYSSAGDGFFPHFPNTKQALREEMARMDEQVARLQDMQRN